MVVVMLGTTARRAALALSLVAGVIGFGLGARAMAAGDGKGYAATVRGCGAYLAEDEAAHIRLVTFDRRADGSLELGYRCVKGGW